MSTTAASTTPAAAGELVPIADRLRYLQAFRFLLAAVVAFAAWVERDSLTADSTAIVIVTVGYLVGSLTLHGTWLLARRAGLPLFGFLLSADGGYLAWSSCATGGA